jgi:hypothetical protein
MKKIQKKRVTYSLMVLALTGGISFAMISTAEAKPLLSKPLFVQCTVLSGTHVVKTGDTCDSGGEGCQSNPC